MSGDDDWFERALTEDDGDEQEAPVEDEAAENGTADDATPTEEAADDDATTHGVDIAEPAAPGDADASDGATDAATAADQPAEDAGDGGPAEADDDLFEDGFADAFGGDDGDVAADEEAAFGGGGGAFGDSGPFDGASGDPFDGGDGPFDGGGSAGGDLFGGDDPFGGDGAFGMGELGDAGDGPDDFSDEALDSELDRIDLGIEGLDEMIRGGVPTSSLMTIIGSAGTGKTTFGLQFLEHGLADGEKTIYITLEESRERVVRSAEEKGWPFETYLAEGQLAVVDIDPIEMATSLSSIRSELPRLVESFGASRLVLDSVSLLEMMYDDQATRRNEIYAFARSLKEAGVTVLLTSEASQDNPYASRHGIVEYLTDAVYILQYVRPSDFRETRLAVEIQKIRDAHHSREMKPYEITDDGISVYRQANIF